MKNVLRILAVVLYFIVFCYVFTSLYLALYHWVEYSMQYSFVIYLEGYFVTLWKNIRIMYEHGILYAWFRDYGSTVILSLVVALVVLLIIKRKWLVKQFKNLSAWLRKKKHNSKDSRIKRLEEELEQLKKGK